MTDALILEARALAGTNPTLIELIRFTRAHDPTDDFRQQQGSQFEARRDEMLAAAQAFVFTGTPFTGSAAEVLLCMAHCVASAPYLGWSQAQVELYLGTLLRRIAEATPSA
ncbi:MAG TPA: hypothetical protein PKW88_14605 [Plasticicumulans sp.]|nr:hypothetical protein [Plasticicumulans sp.]HMZ11944.1 hypothetical protein [Plasticicumulans sp.]HNF67106.1 hypothetical protein [Plasticicumulans sp.]